MGGLGISRLRHTVAIIVFWISLGCCNIAWSSPSVAGALEPSMRLKTIPQYPQPPFSIRHSRSRFLLLIPYPFFEFISLCRMKVTTGGLLRVDYFISMYTCRSNQNPDKHFIQTCSKTVPWWNGLATRCIGLTTSPPPSMEVRVERCRQIHH